MVCCHWQGKLAFDVVSLMPPTFNNRKNGMRPKLASMLYDLHPKFFRFPGGCFVEGQQSPDNAFRWERTIGPIEERPGHWNVNWAIAQPMASVSTNTCNWPRISDLSRSMW